MIYIGDIVTCVNKDKDFFDITIGNTYVVKDVVYIDNEEYVEIEYNDSEEPYTYWPSNWFKVAEA